MKRLQSQILHGSTFVWTNDVTDVVCALKLHFATEKHNRQYSCAQLTKCEPKWIVENDASFTAIGRCMLDCISIQAQTCTHHTHIPVHCLHKYLFCTTAKIGWGLEHNGKMDNYIEFWLIINSWTYEEFCAKWNWKLILLNWTPTSEDSFII